MSAIDPRDAILQAHTPALMVPRYGELAPLEKSGHRYLVAEDGLWLEVRRPWLHARVPLSDQYASDHMLPFGALEQSIAYGFTTEDWERMQTLFLYDARQALPDECAAWAVYDERTKRLEYRALAAAHAGPGGLQGIERPRLQDHEHLAIDLHSHGQLGAFFSATDDADDAGEVKFAAVAGRLDTTPAWATRLCLLGVFIGADAETIDDALAEERA